MLAWFCASRSGDVGRVTLALASMLVAALVVGMLIGCVGIGGVLLTPALVYVGGLGFHLAAATSMWAFLFAGVAATSIYSKHGRSIGAWRRGWGPASSLRRSRGRGPTLPCRRAC